MSSTNENEKADSATVSRVMADEERGYALQLHDKMETEYLHPGSSHAGSTEEGLAHPSGAAPHSRYGYSAAYGYAADRAQVFWDRLCGKGRRRIGWIESLRNIATASREWPGRTSVGRILNCPRELSIELLPDIHPTRVGVALGDGQLGARYHLRA